MKPLPRFFLAAVCLPAILGHGLSRAQELAEIYVFKAAWYEQLTAGDPVLFPQAEDPFDYTAVAYLSAETLADPDWALWINGMTLRTPAGRTEALDVDFGGGSFVFYEGAVTAQALNLRYGVGNHRFTLSSVLTGTSNYDVPLAADDYPPAPKVTNFDAARHVDPTRDFTLRWSAFDGAGDRTIWLEIADAETFDLVFDPGPLDGDATSTVIPAGTLVEGRDYEATLTFTRYTHQAPTSVPSTYSGFEAYNRVPLHAGGGGGIPDPSRFTAWNRLPNGDLELTLECTPGIPLTLQGTGALSGGWTVVQTLVPATTQATLTVTRATLGSSQYLRAFQE